MIVVAILALLFAILVSWVLLKKTDEEEDEDDDMNR